MITLMKTILQLLELIL